ncbi:RsmD family RNA methyltransferase, partial [Saccharomonospora iraqiensis]|uniref:RsmD family RNA methyltransferase n=1 Tax=Saccharomonospora iraqiensis TaxID=52698 RepID=UPI0018EFF4EA
MTRIVAGRAGGRTLSVPPKGTRPTSERVREALFNALDAAGDLRGARVLDLYAGSGALGLEALSRGAADALFVESDRAAVQVLRDNVARVGLGGRVRHGTVQAVLAAG